MRWKTAYRSFYYETPDAPEDIVLDPKRAANLPALEPGDIVRTDDSARHVRQRLIQN